MIVNVFNKSKMLQKLFNTVPDLLYNSSYNYTQDSCTLRRINIFNKSHTNNFDPHFCISNCENSIDYLIYHHVVGINIEEIKIYGKAKVATTLHMEMIW